MKLKFTKQDYQMAAVQSVVDLFKGQEKLKETFSVEKGNQLSLYETGLGIKICLTISKERLLENLHEVQKRNGLQQTDDIDYLQFSIEMETGTGKTYVFVRTIYELNRLYGFTKFIIVVPSIPIREGDYKFLEITREHFAADYDRTPIRYFIYNSARLSDVRQFATSGNIEVMIINIDAFKKAENIIKEGERVQKKFISIVCKGFSERERALLKDFIIRMNYNVIEYFKSDEGCRFSADR